jgi:phosphoglycolate phosphatase-like HAD superfamily hydrolase
MIRLPGTVLGMTLAVFDIDGVVADVRHRLHHIERRPKQWSAFFGAAGDDPPLSAGLVLVAELAARHEIVWVTGRPDWLRSTTREWLESHGLPATEVHMRADGDRRPARVYKVGVLRRLSSRAISAFFDDDPEVVEAARYAGFPAVLADWVPRSGALRDAQERLGRS